MNIQKHSCPIKNKKGDADFQHHPSSFSKNIISLISHRELASKDIYILSRKFYPRNSMLRN